VKLDAERNAIPRDALSQLKEQYEGWNGPVAYRTNAAQGWVRDDTRGQA
jgi:hypothetical protein